MLNRLCVEVLPVIANQIERFHLESSSIKEIFYAAHYSELSHLALYKMTEESARFLFTGKIDDCFLKIQTKNEFLSIFLNLSLCLDERLSSVNFRNQIRTLLLTIDDHGEKTVDEIYYSMCYICENLLTVFQCLVTLTFESSSNIDSIPLSFKDNRFDSFCSSTLLKLKICVDTFDDCLYLFDGRFDRVESVDLNVCRIHRSTLVVNQVRISMKITSDEQTIFFRIICLK